MNGPNATVSNTSAANAKSNADETSQNDLCRDLRTLEERRKSLLDHHWAVPSKDRFVVCSPQRRNDPVDNISKCLQIN